MKKPILTITVNSALDVTVGCGSQMRGLPCSPTGETNLASPSSVVSAGGKGINVARALRALGERVLAAGFVDVKTGRLFKRFLSEEKIPARFVRVKNQTRVNVTVLGPAPGESQRFLGDGARVSAKEIQEFERKYLSWLRFSRVVVLSGRNAFGAPVDWYAKLVRLAHRQKVMAVLDTSGEAFKQALKAKPFLIKPNLQEAQDLTQERLNSSSKIKKVVRYFHSLGVSIVLLSLGDRGAVASDGREILVGRQSTFSNLNVLSDIGCGDAFLAGFISAQSADKDLYESLRRAVACGSANTINLLPGLINVQDVIKLEKKVVVEEQ